MKKFLLGITLAFVFGQISANASIGYPGAEFNVEEYSYAPGYQEPKFDLAGYNEQLGGQVLLILELPISDDEKIKSIKQVVAVLRNLYRKIYSSPDLNFSEYLFLENKEGSGFVDDILQLPISDEKKVECIRFIQEKVNIYDSGPAPDKNYLEYLLVCFYEHSWEKHPNEFHGGLEDLKNDIKLLAQNGFYKLDHIDSKGNLTAGSEAFNAEKLLADILSDKI